jgi:hypothetical protein
LEVVPDLPGPGGPVTSDLPAPGGPTTSPRLDAEALCASGIDGAATPVEYGACELVQAEAELGIKHTVSIRTAGNADAERLLGEASISLDARPESFVVFRAAGRAFVIGRDQVGAMYGAFELAERLRLEGSSALALPTTLVGAPDLPIRAANPFLVLPAAGESSWWFLDDGYWREYLDMLARARMNFLDIHAMYNLDNTIFPNALLYFATSSTYRNIGVDPAERERNLAMLKKVIRMASVRGIRVGLMSYRADTSPLGDQPPTLDDQAIHQYTREAVADLASRATGLWRLGFRIGESGRPADWYLSSFVAGVNDANSGVGIYTRTWWAKRSDIMSIAGAARGDTIVEAKYNGEHFAAPYAIAGGEFVRWGGYSYESFLDPPSPYTFVFQLRAGGTHRIFRFASFERSRRTALSFSFSPRIKGFTLEPSHAYYPQRDFYHANAADRFSAWTFRRDEMMYFLMGRLSYDAATPERVFQALLKRRVGTDGLWDAVQAASDIVPWIQTANTCGPDARNFAPELELGKDVGYWAGARDITGGPTGCSNADHGPFDTFAVASPFEAAADLVNGVATARLSPVDIAGIVLRDAARARAAAVVKIDPDNAEARDVVRECVALADLGDYFGHKLRAATALAVYKRTADPEWLNSARIESDDASSAWRLLAQDTAYIAPFEEKLRMEQLGLKTFHWRNEVESLSADASSIDAIAASMTTSPTGFYGQLPSPERWLATVRDPGPGLGKLMVEPADPRASSWTIDAEFARPLPQRATVNLLWKPFESTRPWVSVPMTRSGPGYQATIPGTGAGAMFAVEIVGPPGQGWRYPDVLTETPYRTLAP